MDITRYFKFDISNFRCLVTCVFFFSFFWGLETKEGRFFQTLQLAVAGQELSTISMWAQSFNSWLMLVFLLILWILDYLFSSMIKQVPNSLTVHDNSWTLKFDNFPEFQNVISDSPQRAPLRHTAYENRCDSSFS